MINQPTLFLGKGKINLNSEVVLGYFPSPSFYSGYIHIEARDEKSEITIGDECLIGHCVEILSSDFHNIEPEHRRGSKKQHISRDVIIGKNVWIGNSVKILKGVNIDDNSIIAAGSVVVKNVSANTIVAGNPAKEVKKI